MIRATPHAPSRRSFVTGSLALAAGAIAPQAIVARALAQTPTGPFTLAALPYASNALEPAIDARTMEIHHGRHHAAYVSNLNAALKDHGEVAKMPLETMLSKIAELPEAIRTAVRNNGGGHANHTMFWQVMGKEGGAPTGELAAAIDRDLGGIAKMQADFNTAGLTQFGSGWAFVTVSKDGKLAITKTPNQDTPLMQGQRVLFGNDVWEHAYYLTYQNRRADYLKTWWSVVNWKAVATRYAAAKAGTLTI